MNGSSRQGWPLGPRGTLAFVAFFVTWMFSHSIVFGLIVAVLAYAQSGRFSKILRREDVPLSERMTRYFEPSASEPEAGDVPHSIDPMARPAEAARMPGTGPTNFSSRPPPKRKPIDLPRHR